MVKTDAVERSSMPREHGDGGEYVETVTLDDVRAVFDDVRGPVVLSADVSDALGCSRETARRKLAALYDRGEVDRRKVSRRVLYWQAENDESGARADAVDDATDGPADPPPDAHGAERAGEEDALDAVLADLPSTVDPADARETIHTAREFLREAGPATKAAIVREIMPTHPLGYDADDALAKIDAGDRYRGAWWRRVVKPGLEALPDVSKPPAGASEWKATEGGT
jgi:hypothetical protein